MDWKLTGDRPIWQQLTEQVALRILTGEYPPGSRLPAVRELAAQAGVNPNTMQRAMAQLEQDGLAVGSRTAGRTVTVDGAGPGGGKAVPGRPGGPGLRPGGRRETDRRGGGTTWMRKSYPAGDW